MTRTALAIVCVCGIHLLVAQTIAIPPTVSDYLSNENNTVTEDGLLPTHQMGPDSQAASEFIKYVINHWKQILASIDQIAPDARRQCLIVVAAESLPPSDYLQFVNAVCD